VLDGVVHALAATEQRVSAHVWRRDGVTASGSSSLMLSEDEGETWTTHPLLLQDRYTETPLIDTRQGTLIAGTQNGIFRSADRGRSWTQTGPNSWNVALAADRGRWYAFEPGRQWTSTDGGLRWSESVMTIGGSPTPLSPSPFSSVFDAPDGRTAAVVSGMLTLSADRGSTWEPPGLDNRINALVRIDDVWYAATQDGVFRSSDLSSWVQCSAGLGSASGLVVTGEGDLLAGAFYDVVRSTDRCRSWWPLPTTGPRGRIAFLFRPAPDTVLSLGAGISLLDMPSRTWTQVKDEQELTITAAAEEDRGRYWMATAHGVYLLVLRDGTWQVWPMGLDGERITSLAVDPNGYLLAAVEGRGLFRASLP
jgi:hypothetical protein